MRQPTFPIVDEVSPSIQDFGQDVAEGLSSAPKRLSSRHFYDAHGSVLFEQITQLPEYYLTRTEQAIFDRYAPDIARAGGGAATLIEFGSGSSAKTRTLLRAVRPEVYCPIDISAEFLRLTAEALTSELDWLSVRALAAEYSDAMGLLRDFPAPRLIVFMGSNIGNFCELEAIDFLGRITANMDSDDRLLIGFDRLKERDMIQAAYNDSQGITAAFNKNLLARINRELGGTFMLDEFDHQAPWLEEESRIEMRLISRRNQTALAAALGIEFSFAEGETILTEVSHKYSDEAIERILSAAGLIETDRWSNDRAWFTDVMARPN